MGFILNWILGMLALAACVAVVALVWLFITSYGLWAWLIVTIIFGGFMFAMGVQ